MMKTRFGSAVFFAIATVTTVVLAQSNPVPPTQQPTTQAPPTAAPSPPASATVSQDKDHQITLTGCLENAPAATAGTAGTSAPEPVKRLVLTNAISAADSAAKTATAPGFSGRPHVSGHRQRGRAQSVHRQEGGVDRHRRSAGSADRVVHSGAGRRGHVRGCHASAAACRVRQGAAYELHFLERLETDRAWVNPGGVLQSRT